MTEEQEKSSEIQPSNVARPLSPWKVQLGGVLWQWMTVGGMSIGGLVTMLNTTDLPKVAIGSLVGGAMTGGASIAYALASPTAKKTKEAAEIVGKSLATTVETKVLGIDDRYLELQREDCQTACCDGITQIFVPLLEEIFVPLSISFGASLGGWDKLDRSEELLEDLGRDAEPNIWKLLKAAEKNSAYRQMAVLAWGGYGKTTLLRHITYIYSSKQHGKYKVSSKFPAFLPLKKYGKTIVKAITDGNTIDLAQLIQNHHAAYLSKDLLLPEDWAKKKLNQGEMVVLFDGLDEVSEEIRPHVTRWLKDAFRQYSTSKSIFILTARPKAYTEQAVDSGSRLEMRMMVWVEPLTPAQQDAFVKQWYGYQEIYANGGRSTSDVTRRANEKATSLLAQIRERSEISDLAKIPLLLNMIATFHLLSKSPTLPQRRVELYQAIARLQLFDRPGAKELDTLLRETDAQVILQRLAYGMMVPKREKTIAQGELVDRFTAYLQQENEKVAALPFLREVVRVSELLVEREVGEYEFAHWSFQEYFAASWIFSQGLESELLSRFEEKEWKPLILLYVGMLKNPSGLIQQMIDRNAMELAAACLKETTKQIDPEVLRSLSVITEKVADIRYAKLETLLKTGQWKEADAETYRVMIQVCGKEEGQDFSRQDLETFPCEDLQTIDRLWVNASNGHFGFSVQKKIWEECGSPMEYNDDYKKFGEKVGWRSGEYFDFKFSLSLSLKGELPCLNVSILINYLLFSFLAQRLVNCNTQGIKNVELRSTILMN